MEEEVLKLESSVNFLKEKIKNSDLARTNLENRLSAMENKMIGLANCSTKVEKENLSNFDSNLSGSPLFRSSLMKVDNNSTANLKKMEEYFGQLILQSHSKFQEIEERLLGMLSQKQKILRTLSFQIQNQGHSITAIEEWIRMDHQQGNSLHIAEQNIRQKMQMIQKNLELKSEVVEEKIKYLQQFKESVRESLKNMGGMKEQMEGQLKKIRKEMESQKTELNSLRAKEENSRQDEEISKAIKTQVKRFKQEMDEVKRQINQINRSIQNVQNDQNVMRKKIISLQNNIPEPEKQYPDVRFEESRTKGSYQKNFSQSMERKKNSELDSYSRRNQKSEGGKNAFSDVSRPEKKQLPPRKNLFNQQMGNTEEQVSFGASQMRGGLRGLLQKSREKQKKQLKREESFGRPQTGSKKGLPPVKEDTTAKKRTQQGWLRQSEIEQEQAVVYQLDEDGYLLDEQGNYLLDSSNHRIQLSPQQIEQYAQEQ